MHKSYQPLKPTTNKYLQKKWDQTRFEDHRNKIRDILDDDNQQFDLTSRNLRVFLSELKVRAAKPVVNTRGIQTPAHVQLKLKKLQVQEERSAVIERDNQLLATRLTAISRSKGLVDHWNHYSEYSLNAERRRAELLHVTHENQAIYQRITERKSEYRKELWEENWEKVGRRRDDIARYPRGVTDKQTQKPNKCVKFSAGQSQRSSSGVEDDREITED